MPRQPTRKDPWRAARIALFTLPLFFGSALAWRAAWLGDDIFITFRYIDNWSRGLGLVFNAGERVEGYTHFLWLLMLAAVHRLGFDLLGVGRVLPFLAWLALLAILFGRAVREPREAGQAEHAGWLALPIAAWGLALHHDAQMYATSGLETMFFALLITLGLLLVAGRRPRSDLAAIVYALAVLVRPEGLLYGATALLYVFWRRRSWRDAGRFALLWLGLVAPWIAWKTGYYGTPIPNTYYAKSASLSYWGQGWEYTRLYFEIYLVLPACALLALVGWWIARRAHRRATLGAAKPSGSASPPPEAPTGLVPLALVQVLLTVLYVARVGGDFMFARFYIPVTPLLYLAAEEAGRSLGRRWVQVALAGLVVGGTLAVPLERDRFFKGTNLVHGITDEPKWYTQSLLQACRHQGEVAQTLCNGTGARLLIPAGRVMVAYFGRIPYALEGTGLTDPEIAHQPLEKRGRPGHEKGASEALLARRRVSLVLLWGPHRAVGLQPFEQLRYGDVYFRLVYYDAPVMDALAKLGAVFVPMPAYLDQYLATATQYSPAKLQADFERFDFFYFQHNDDPVRRARFETLLHGGPGATP